ncbi:MAG: hypothetical protein GTO22_14335 [Gemmatimonadales bacterium]|nr:hypothetical protein [Gemmatimonadales bacterium]
MPFQLLDLEVDEIAFVDKGAGVGVRLALFKRRKESHVNQLVDKMLKSLTAAKADPAALANFETLAKQGATLDDIKAKLTVEEWEVIMTALAEAAAPAGESTPGEMTEAGEGDESEREDVEAGDTGDVAKPDLPIEEEEEEMTAKHREELDKNREELAKAQERIASLEKAARFAKFQKTAEKYSYAPGSVDQIAKQLMHADDVRRSGDEDLAKSIEQTIEMAHEERKQSKLLKSFGSGAPDLSEDDSVRAQLTAKAEQIRADMAKSKDGKRLSKAQAFMVACQENPELYNQLASERRMNAMRRQETVGE